MNTTESIAESDEIRAVESRRAPLGLTHSNGASHVGPMTPRHLTPVHACVQYPYHTWKRGGWGGSNRSDLICTRVCFYVGRMGSGVSKRRKTESVDKGKAEPESAVDDGEAKTGRTHDRFHSTNCARHVSNPPRVYTTKPTPSTAAFSHVHSVSNHNSTAQDYISAFSMSK